MPTTTTTVIEEIRTGWFVNWKSSVVGKLANWGLPPLGVGGGDMVVVLITGNIG